MKEIDSSLMVKIASLASELLDEETDIFVFQDKDGKEIKLKGGTEENGFVDLNNESEYIGNMYDAIAYILEKQGIKVKYSK